MRVGSPAAADKKEHVPGFWGALTKLRLGAGGACRHDKQYRRNQHAAAIFPNAALGFISLSSMQHLVGSGRENREKKRLLPIGLLFPGYTGKVISFI
jgi:hypothetical protein